MITRRSLLGGILAVGGVPTTIAAVPAVEQSNTKLNALGLVGDRQAKAVRIDGPYGTTYTQIFVRHFDYTSESEHQFKREHYLDEVHFDIFKTALSDQKADGGDVTRSRLMAGLKSLGCANGEPWEILWLRKPKFIELARIGGITKAMIVAECCVYPCVPRIN